MNIELLINIGLKVVVGPQTPDTMLGPDYLVRNEKKLFALFVLPNEFKQKDIDIVFVKLTEVKLNYPSKTNTILIIKGELSALHEKLKSKFDRIVEEKDFANENIYKEEKDDEVVKDTKRIQQKFNEKKYDIYLKNLDFVKQLGQWDKIDVSTFTDLKKAKYTDWVTGDFLTTRANIFEYGDMLLGHKVLDNKKSDIEDINPYYKFAMLRDFKIEDKNIEFADFSLKVLEIDKNPSYANDHFKPLRLLSGAGWIIQNNIVLDDLNDLEAK